MRRPSDSRGTLQRDVEFRTIYKLLANRTYFESEKQTEQVLSFSVDGQRNRDAVGLSKLPNIMVRNDCGLEHSFMDPVPGALHDAQYLENRRLWRG